MTDQLVHKFPRLKWLEAQDFLSRKVIFLDLNFWIEMTEGQHSSYIRLKEILSKLVAERKVVCPVSPTLLLELKKRPTSDEKRTKYCHLMNELSQGLSIKLWTDIFKGEFKRVIEQRRIEPEIAFSHFLDALYSGGQQLVFDKLWSEADASKASHVIFDSL